uniref:DUF5672 domain-containing protein n=1 Tax=viral metagenome TaxID=1070528 RepID=A0A6C0IFE3_9ZZZZ
MENNTIFSDPTSSLPIIIYSHSSYSDILHITICRLKKYAEKCKIIIFSNIILHNEYEHILYDENFSYSKRIEYCLNIISAKYSYLLFMHENNTLYDYMNYDHMHHVYHAIITKNIDQLRLCKNGVPNNNIEFFNKLDKYIFEIPKNDSYIFSVQPTIWKISTFLEIMQNKDYNYRNIELNIDKYMLKYLNCFYYNNEETFINTNRCKSTIFPLLHLTAYGKWLYSENIPYIDELFSEYNIDKSIRGYI